MDILLAKLRYQRAAVQNAVDGEIEGIAAKIVLPRDLILLKMLAAPNRPELSAQMQDKTDIVGVLEFNSKTITPDDIRYVGDRLLELCFTAEEGQKTVKQIEWLNETLDALNMPDRKYPLPA